MAKSIMQYKSEYNQFKINSCISMGMASACGVSHNYPGMLFTGCLTLFQLGLMQYSYVTSKYAKEYKALNSFYKSVREELVKNIKTLEQGDIPGIFSYLCFILHKNILSYDRHLPRYHVEGIFNEASILAALTLNGHGVCRNIAPALSDLYRDFSIDSTNVMCDHYEVQRIIEINADDYLTEEDYHNIERQKSFEEKIYEINRIFEKVAKRLEEQGIIKKDRRQRHCINLVNDSEYSYLLDASTYQYYADKDEDGKYYSNMGNYFRVVNDIGYKNPYKNTIKPKLEIPHPIMPDEEFSEEISKRREILEENIDIIEQMHKDIEPMLFNAEETYKLILHAK